MIKIRQAVEADLLSINEIYNEAVLTTTGTFDTEPKSLEERKAWFEKHGPRYPILVAVKDNQVQGWASVSPWSEREAYFETSEVSLYVNEIFREQGVGKRLLGELIEAAQKVGMHTIISRITNNNAPSIHLHDFFGFRHIGVMKECGKKFGKLLDVCLMQKIFPL